MNWVDNNQLASQEYLVYSNKSLSEKEKRRWYLPWQEFFLILHGLVHLWYLVLAFRLVEYKPDMGWTG